MTGELKTRLPIYWLIGITTIIGSYLFFCWSYKGGLDQIADLMYPKIKTNNMHNRLQIIVNNSYYYAVIALFFLAMSKLVTFISTEENKKQIQLESNNSLKTGMYALLVFIGLLYKLLFQKQVLKLVYIKLLSCWFIFGVLLFIFGTWMKKIAKINLSVPGIIFLIMLYLLIIGQILKKNLIHDVLSL